MPEQVLLVGSYPPPYGGCSVHVQRLQRALGANFRAAVIDVYGGPRAGDDCSVLRCGAVRPISAMRLLSALRRRRAPIVHFHASGLGAFLWASYPMLAALPRATRAVITIHSGSFVRRFENAPGWRRALLKDVLRRFYRIVVVNREQLDFLERLGLDPQRIRLIPAFLPPVAAESERAREALASVDGSDRILVASGYGARHYGFHVILDALELARDAGKRGGLILCLYNSYDEAYLTELSRRIGRSVPGTIVRDLSPEEFAWLLERCDTYVRATDRDGDAVALREASYFGKSVVASDCVERPPEALTFRTGDAQSLAATLEEARTRPPVRKGGADGSNGLSALLAVYREALCA